MYVYQELLVDGKEGITSHQPTTATQLYIIYNYTGVYSNNFFKNSHKKIMVFHLIFIIIIDFTQELLGAWDGGVGISGE